jgi:hypothetical protein
MPTSVAALALVSGIAALGEAMGAAASAEAAAFSQNVADPLRRLAAISILPILPRIRHAHNRGRIVDLVRADAPHEIYNGERLVLPHPASNQH